METLISDLLVRCAPRKKFQGRVTDLMGFHSFRWKNQHPSCLSVGASFSQQSNASYIYEYVIYRLHRFIILARRPVR